MWDGCMVEPGRRGARQGRVPVPHSTAVITLGGRPRGVAGMGPGLTRGGAGGAGGAYLHEKWRTILKTKKREVTLCGVNVDDFVGHQ